MSLHLTITISATFNDDVSRAEAERKVRTALYAPTMVLEDVVKDIKVDHTLADVEDRRSSCPACTTKHNHFGEVYMPDTCPGCAAKHTCGV